MSPHDLLDISPVGFDDLVQYVREWAVGEGFTLQAAAQLPLADDVGMALSSKVANAIISGCVAAGHIKASEGGYPTLKSICRGSVGRKEWKMVKGSRSRVTAVAITRGICRTFDDQIELMTRILMACGFGSRPVSEVTTIITLTALSEE